MGPAQVTWTGRAEGDLRGPDAPHRRDVFAGPWAWCRQVHGTRVHVVDGAGGAGDGDALVTASTGLALAVFTADCAPVAFASAEGLIGVAHAGWRGLEAGVLQATVDALARLGATGLAAALGPCIHPCCYEFGPTDLEGLERRFGSVVRASTADGRPAFDLPAAVGAALDRAGVPLILDADSCTGCDPGWYSHRRRGDVERQATLIVRPAEPSW